MNKVERKYARHITAWILIISILSPTFIAFASQQSTGHYEEGNAGRVTCADGDGGSYYNTIKSQLPTTAQGQISPKSISVSIGGKPVTLYLNYWIWNKKQLVVYGDYTKVHNNNFMCGTAPRNDNGTPVITENAGFYKVNLNSVVCERHGRTCSKKNSDKTIRGEWEYYGYDVNGNKFSNQPYIGQGAQVNMKQLTKKDWVKNPWDNKWKIQYPDKYAPRSDYNELAVFGKGKGEYTQKWIRDSMEVMDPTDPKVISLDGSDPEVWNYLNVMQRPTIHNSGSGRMYHVSLNDGKLYYYTFNIPVIKEKRILNTKIEAKLILPSSVPPDNSYPNHTQKITIKVRATYDDKDYYTGSDVLKQEAYTREDLETWLFDINIPSLGKKISNSSLKHVLVKGGVKVNFIDAAFEINVTNAELKAIQTGNTITATASATAKPIFSNKVHGYAATDSATDSIKVGDSVGGSVTVFHRGTDGALLDVDNHNNLAMGSYTYRSKTFTGYTLQGNNTQIVSLTKEKRTQVVTFLYKAKEEKPPDKKLLFIPTLQVNNRIGEIAFDGIIFNDATDSTDLSKVIERNVYVDGVSVDPNTFFNGQYTFRPTTDKNGYFATVNVEYKLSLDDIKAEGYKPEELAEVKASIPSTYRTTDYVYVYPTKPIAQFKLISDSWKENRLLKLNNISESGNLKLVLDRYPITEYEWSYGGDDTQKRMGTDSDLYKELLYKKAGTYSITLRCKNTLDKWSDPYILDFQVLEDYKPNIEVNLNESSISRNDVLSAYHYDINSTDGDKIESAKIELWYDSDADGQVDKKEQEWNGLGDNGICEKSDFPEYTATKLGYYKYIITAKEKFVGVSGQDTLVDKVDGNDQKENKYEVEFWVDNFVPLSDVYIDAPIQRPHVDLFTMIDKNMDENKRQEVLNSRMSIENSLLTNNIIPSVNMWNMKTYIYEQDASTTNHTGSSYPSSTMDYASNGYAGILNLSKAVDNGHDHDFGYTATKTEDKTITSYVTGYSTTTYTYNGRSWSESYSSTDNNNYPQSYSDSEGYSGTIYQNGEGYKTGTSNGSPPSKPKKGDSYSNTTYFRVDGSGTAYKTTSYWVKDVRWVNDYTGYYSGKIYKAVRAPYTDPWNSSNIKYILYMSDDRINELNDFNSTIGKTDAKIILAGKKDIQSQCTKVAKFIDVTGKTTAQVLKEAIDYISENTPTVESICILQNQSFTLNFGETDLDGDTIVRREMQYVHNKDYFDNPTGQEPNTLTAFDKDTGWSTSDVRNKFANVGKYQIFRRVKDKPSGDLGDKYSYYSGATEVDIVVHRKPIAIATLDWDFDGVSNTYKTTWVDKSYDLDHNLSRANKGIVERKIMWRKDGGEWNYTIPDNLSAGTYNLRYYVKDIENVWSDIFTIDINGNKSVNVTEVTFILDISPPMQFQASLRAEDIKFRNSTTPITLPASENLQVFDTWTRYPINPTLSMALYNGSGTQMSPTKSVYFNNSTATKIDNDISWKDISYTAPATLVDGSYMFKISANSNQSKTILIPVNLNTPINLLAYINGQSTDAIINSGEVSSFIFNTSKYVTSTQLLFEGKQFTSASNQIQLKSSNDSQKIWECKLDLPFGDYVDDKQAIAEFKAILPSGMYQLNNVNYTIRSIRADNFYITKILDIGWREYYFDITQGKDNNHDGRIDSYMQRQNTDIGASKMPVNYYSLVSYPRTFVKSGYKVKGKINIQGKPDSASFKVYYYVNKSLRNDTIQLSLLNGNTYLFEWIIPLETDSKSFVRFDLATRKGSYTYGNERWLEAWDVKNIDRKILYIKGSAMDDLNFVQSQ